MRGFDGEARGDMVGGKMESCARQNKWELGFVSSTMPMTEKDRMRKLLEDFSSAKIEKCIKRDFEDNAKAKSMQSQLSKIAKDMFPESISVKREGATVYVCKVG